MKRAFNPIVDFLSFLELYKVIKNSKADIVHTNSTKAGILGSLASKLSGKKTVYTVHGLSQMNIGSPVTKFITKLIEKFTSKFRNKLITVSDYDKNFIVENGITTSDKVVRVYNGVEEIQFLDKAEARNKLGITSEKTIIGAVARLQYLKGIDLLIEAFSQLPKEQQQNTHLVVIGDGPDKTKIETQINELNLGQSVTLLGEKPDAAKYLKAFDIIVSPSRLEGFPFGLIEALQSEVPVLATDVGGVSELVAEGGLLVKTDPKSISEKLSELLNNNNLKTKLGEAAKIQAKKFSNQNMIAETEKVYLNL